MSLADPGKGSNAGLNSLKSGLVNQIADIGTIRQSLESIRTGRASVWQATSAEQWDGEVAELHESFMTVLNSHNAVEAAILTYTLELDAIRADFVSVSDDYDTAVGTLNRQYFLPSVDSTERAAAVSRMQREQGQAETAKKEAESAHEGLVQRRSAADSVLVGVINDSMPADWTATYNALKKIGISDFSTATDAQIAEALKNYVGTALEDKKFSDAELATLQALFAGYSDDPEVMSLLFVKLKGQGTYDLLTVIAGPLVSDNLSESQTRARLELAQLLRTGLAVGSVYWADSTADAFIDSFLENQSLTGGSGLSLLGFLFDGDGPWMSESLTVAAANAMDLAERVDGWGLYGAGTTPLQDSTTLALGTSLAVLERQYGRPIGTDVSRFAENDYLRVIDPMGNILRTLGQYPASATEFLAPNGTVDSAKIEYWFRTRDWSEFDRFEGVNALLAGVQKVPGGPLTAPDPNNPASYDPAAWELVANITGEALDNVAQNPKFHSENISDHAAKWLAGVLSVHLPGFITSPLGDPTVTEGQFSEASNLGGLIDKRIYALLGPANLHILLGIVGDNTAGAEIFKDTLEEYKEKLFAALGNPQASASGVLQTVAIIQAVYDASIAGNQLIVASRSDAQAQANIDAFKEAFGLIPLRLNYIGGIAVAEGTDFLSGLASSAWASEYEKTWASQSGDKTNKTVEMQESLALAFWRSRQPQGGIPGVSGPEAFNGEVHDWFEHYESQLNEALDNRIAGATFGTLANAYYTAYGDALGDTKEDG